MKPAVVAYGKFYSPNSMASTIGENMRDALIRPFGKIKVYTVFHYTILRDLRVNSPPVNDASINNNIIYY